MALQKSLEGFGGDGAGVGAFDRNLARADKLGEAAVHVYHPFVNAGLDDSLYLVCALLADEVCHRGVVEWRVLHLVKWKTARFLKNFSSYLAVTGTP